MTQQYKKWNDVYSIIADYFEAFKLPLSDEHNKRFYDIIIQEIQEKVERGYQAERLQNKIKESYSGNDLVERLKDQGNILL